MKRYWIFMFVANTIVLNVCQADLVIFHNGDYAFGNTRIGDTTEEILIDLDGVTKKYHRRQIRDIMPGVSKPADGEVLQASDFVYSATGMVPDVTAPITVRSRFPSGNDDDKEIIFDMESGFEVKALQLFPANYGFYNRPGSYLVILFENLQTKEWRAVEFRATIYGPDDRLLGSRDFYVWKISGVNEKINTRKTVSLPLPDIPYELIERIRLVRKF